MSSMHNFLRYSILVYFAQALGNEHPNMTWSNSCQFFILIKVQSHQFRLVYPPCSCESSCVLPTFTSDFPTAKVTTDTRRSSTKCVCPGPSAEVCTQDEESASSKTRYSPDAGNKSIGTCATTHASDYSKDGFRGIIGIWSKLRSNIGEKRHFLQHITKTLVGAK
jgi:hypothetical protein